MSTLSAILDMRKKRLALQREADLLEQEEKGLVGDLINEMNIAGQRTLKEGHDEVVLHTSDEPNVTNWPALLDYIVQNEAVDLLQKRVTPNAIKGRWADGINIPGVESVTKQTIKFI